MPFSFKGGIHPEDKKALTENKAIEVIPAPAQVILPVSMHIGAPCNPLVAAGDTVKVGQRIAESTAPVSAPVHASVSGTVVAVEPRLHPNGSMVMSVVIENDFQDTPEQELKPVDKFQDLTAEELAEIAKDAGLVGLGGAAFPLHIKIKSAIGKVDTLIINGAECEPYITSDNRMMLEHTDELIEGATIIMKALGLDKVHIAVESNKREAIAKLRRISEQKSHIKLEVLRTKYPQGSEKHLIKAVTGREVPPGGLPADAGAINVNVASVIALYRAVEQGKPLTHKVVTVSGEAVANPKNLLVPLGTPIGELIDACGGLKEEPSEIIMGGPMMGIGQYSVDVPVIKGTNAILALIGKDDVFEEDPVCIRCGKCVTVCPMNLMPIYINMYANKGRLDECEKYRVMDCIECGCCSYTCPGRLHLVQTFRKAKQAIIAEKKKGQ